MADNLKIAVFGATGKVGAHFVDQALAAGHKLQVLVRDKSKFKHSENPDVEVLVGDATKADDVEKAVSGVDVVVSCLGNVSRKIRIMKASHNNIMNTAAKQAQPPRCLMISSIGCGGTSWLIKGMLFFILGRAGYLDYENADKRIREEDKVPFVLVRPAILKDKPGSGAYRVLKKPSVIFPKSIPRADVAKFFLDCLTDKSWDEKSGLILAGSKPRP